MSGPSTGGVQPRRPSRSKLPSSSSRRRSIPQGAAIVRPSRIPAPLRFPLVAILSLTISALAFSAVADFRGTGSELGKVSRRLERWEEVVGLVGWRW